MVTGLMMLSGMLQPSSHLAMCCCMFCNMLHIDIHAPRHLLGWQKPWTKALMDMSAVLHQAYVTDVSVVLPPHMRVAAVQLVSGSCSWLCSASQALQQAGQCHSCSRHTRYAHVLVWVPYGTHTVRCSDMRRHLENTEPCRPKMADVALDSFKTQYMGTMKPYYCDECNAASFASRSGGQRVQGHGWFSPNPSTLITSHLPASCTCQ